jgi:hypothetical protein
MAQFKYLGLTVTNQNLIQEEIKRMVNSGNVCYHSVQKLLSSRLLSKNIKLGIYKTIILPVVLQQQKSQIPSISNTNITISQISETNP